MQKALSKTVRTLLIVLFLSACALAQEPAQALRGTWTATVGKAKVLHGTWTGGVLPHRPNVAVGTWTLVSAGQVVVQGSWRAEKEDRGWEGYWSGHTSQGRSLAGSWGTSFEHWHGRTLQDMLERTLVTEVSGWWQSGHAQGDWWLKGSK